MGQDFFLKEVKCVHYKQACVNILFGFFDLLLMYLYIMSIVLCCTIATEDLRSVVKHLVKEKLHVL